MALSTLGRWSAEEICAAADIAREKGVAIDLGADGSISIGLGANTMQAADQPESEPQAIPAVFSPASLAERWNCSERHIRNLMRTNRLPYFRLSGKLMRIRGGEVERIERLAEPSLPATHLPSPEPRRQAGAKVPEEMRAKIALAAALKAARDLREKPKKTGR
ncbi:hypothetical protein WMC41_00625 [Shinella yambaruensis]|uniref:hypothetical protein n=1 Tax=Shinella yambaruensis TaxID=415996 RepID=UPI003D7B45FA